MIRQSPPEISHTPAEVELSTKLNALLYSRHAPASVPSVPDPKSARADTSSPLTHHAPGVVFGMPIADYLADPSLGSSDLKRLLQAPAVYWWHSRMNPNRPFVPESHAKLKGRALHKLVLEGPEAFDKAFAESPSPEGHPGALVTHEDLKAKCRELGEAVTGTKAELAKRIEAKDSKAIIFDDIVGLFRAMTDRDGLEVLTRDQMAEVRQAAATITLNPHLARAFTGGIGEVSVFWEEEGVPLKARFDYLKPRTVVDLKRFSNQRERPVDVAISLAIAEYRYDVQARHYCDGYGALYALARQGRIFGDCPLKQDWHERIVPPPDLRWTWVFHLADGAPVSKGRDLSPLSPVLNRAAFDVAIAKARYRECLQQFGTDPWVDCEPVREITESDMVSWLCLEQEDV
jgi:hypothetical protein